MPAVPGGAWPHAGDPLAGPGDQASSWQTVRADHGGFALKGKGPRVAYYAFTLSSDRWQKATLRVVTGMKVKGSFAFTDLDLKSGEQDTLTTELTLPRGKYLVSLRAFADGSEDEDTRVALQVVPGEQAADGSLVPGVSAERAVEIHTVLDAPRVSDLELSPDGSLVAISLGEYGNGTDRETWLEIRDTADGRLVRYWRDGGSPSGLKWRDTGKCLAWQTTTGDKATIRTFDLETGETAILLADVEHLGSWRWVPGGRSVIYEIARHPEPDSRKVKRVAHPADRQPWYRDRSDLYQTFLPGGMTRRLTAGPVSPESWRISDDGRRLLFFTSEADYTQRPYMTSTLWLLDLGDLSLEKVLDDPWIGGAEFSPDAAILCLSGSPSAFDGLGRDLPDGVQANDYGGQLFLYDLKTGSPEPITRDFQPAVGNFTWCRADGMIYAKCTDTQYNRVFRFHPRHAGWEAVQTGSESTDEIALPRSGRLAAARGSSVNRPNQVFAVDLKKNRAKLLRDPGADRYRDIRFGKVEAWKAPLPSGENLDGFIYYPPDFDPSQKYPVIVYYYGGTSPITRDFGGRYPKNIWAGQGYVVYVPEPSGAIGYGQEFAARHVNDWGKITAGEVIDSTKALLDEFGWVDREHVGCIGASYGGFLTEYLITRTDIFAAAISHAGISDITSYWGGGLWGYAYGARALAGTFPWSDRDLYVDQSAVYSADKINTPLLLLHGDSDVNVPPGESDQLFTALKLLGKDVEYVRLTGQDHHILDHEQRMVWNDTILAYFARYLKERPAWWDEMYPAPKGWR
ncbi:S9 family peptidase [bacterium CG_4_9_14_3_um_filter_65_15]|nr:MAG: S9 family peptidase [bacterium CG_4_9_14_3_um_filter_65_15]